MEVAGHVNYSSIYELLSKVFGHYAFKSEHQREAIHAVCKFNQDVLVSLPPNSGKSLIYQLPALLHNIGLTIVVSPHLALINDQLKHLEDKGIFCAASVNCQTTNKHAVEEELSRSYCTIRILYLTPNTLLRPEFRPTLDAIKKNNLLKLIAIDEAQCVRYDARYRKEYRMLPIVREIFPNVPIVAMTSVGTPRLNEEIKDILRLQSPKEIAATDVREYYYRYVVPVAGEEKLSDLTNYLSDRFSRSRKGVAIVFCRSQAKCNDVANHLRVSGIKAVVYHSGMDMANQTENMRLWQNGESRVMCATMCFGIGIHNPNVRIIVHYSTPSSLAAYYQQCGRAGRDGRLAECRIYQHDYDVDWLYRNLGNQYHKDQLPPNSSSYLAIKNLYEEDRHDIDKVVDYLKMRLNCRHLVLAEEFAPLGELPSNLRRCYNQCDNCEAKNYVMRSHREKYAQYLYRSSNSQYPRILPR